ncbi:MAG: glycosyltransferase family 4 protein [Pyrinomonadaceae bacterium]
MKILQISSAKNFGGGEKHLVDLCRGLRAKGHEVFVAMRADNGFEEKLNFIPADHILHTSLRNSLDLLSAHNISRFLKKRKIDIVHAHLARDYPPASMAVRLYPRSKLIVTRHVLFPMKNLHKLVLSNVEKAIAVSSAVEANLLKTFPKEKVVCVPNGIDIASFEEKDRKKLSREFRFERNIPFDVPVVGTVGELKPLKGQEDLVIAAGEIVKEFPDTHFVIVGVDNSIDQNYRRKLKRLVKVFGLEKQFTFLDWVEDTTPLLSALDVFVSPSHSESFGLAILEAMASGTAVVSTETGGAKELIDHDKSGFLTAVKDPVDLAKNICALLGDEAKRREFGAISQRIAKERFSLDRMIGRTEEIYQKCLET